MNTHQLEAFRAIMECGSFTRAAERLRVSQPAVSKMIMLLERDCGFALFHRSKNAVGPSQEAHLLFEEVERMLIGIDAIAARAAGIRSLNHGRLHAVAFPSLSTRLLPAILGSFMAEHQGVNISLENRSSRFIIDRVASQNVDFGLGMTMTNSPSVRFEQLLSMNAVCVLPPDHHLCRKAVITASDLANEPFISMGNENGARFEVDHVFEQAGVKPKIVGEAQLSEACCAFVSSGHGLSVVEPFCTVGFHPSELAVRPFDPPIKFNVWLILPRHREPSLLAAAFIAHLRNELAAWGSSRQKYVSRHRISDNLL